MAFDLDEMTIGQAKKVANMFGVQSGCLTLNAMIGKYVIVRTYSAGVWAGVLTEKSGNEVILENARRLWKWFAGGNGISLSEVALYGVVLAKSRIATPVEAVWLEAIEIIPTTTEAEALLRSAEDAKSQ